MYKDGLNLEKKKPYLDEGFIHIYISWHKALIE